MRIYTGYYAQMQRYLNAGILPINIAAWPPRNMVIDSYPTLAPPASLLSAYKQGGVSVVDYEFTYRTQVLSLLDIGIIVADLQNIAAPTQYEDVILCCYEKIGDFCHRHVFAHWFNSACIAAGVDFPLIVEYEV